MSVQLNYAARSDVGLVRSTNQDSGYAGPHLLVLADGMGGPAGGDIASSVAVAHLAPLDDDVHPAHHLLDLLRAADDAAHRHGDDLTGAVPEHRADQHAHHGAGGGPDLLLGEVRTTARQQDGPGHERNGDARHP